MGSAHKRDDFTREAFFDYWMNVHAPISAKAPGPARLRRVRGREHAARDRSRRTRFVEQWFDSEEAFLAASESPEVAAAWDDVPNYAKTTGTFWVAREHVILPPAGR